MKTELKDVLHLYLGCECLYEWNKEPKVELKGKVTASIIDSFYSDNGVIQWVKPILRPLSDMTKLEAQSAYVVIHKCMPKDTLSDTLEYIQGSLGDECSPKVWLWAVKNGFDLFGLIESEQAIDKTLIK